MCGLSTTLHIMRLSSVYWHMFPHSVCLSNYESERHMLETIFFLSCHCSAL